MMKDSLRNEIEDEDFQICTTLHWTRLLFDSYLRRRGLMHRTESDQAWKIPLIIETQDLIYKTEDVVDRVCTETGVGRDGVQLSWKPTPPDQQPPSALARIFFKDMFESTRIKRGSQPAEACIDLDHKLEEWTDEFGIEQARKLHVVVVRDMENYEYLKRYKARF